MSLPSAAMLISQYAFTFPAGHPMRSIRARVAARGPQFDAFPGLGWKAFLLREDGVAGATDNQYAPLYMWPSTQAAGAFLTGPQFAGVCEAFGRPRVLASVLLRHHVDDRAPPPRWCTTGHLQVPALAQLHAHLAAFGDAGPPGRHSAWLALDTNRWILSLHQLWWGDAPVPADGATLYEVAHFSRPA